MSTRANRNRPVRSLVAAGAVAAALCAPMIVRNPDDPTAIVALPWAAPGEAVRAGLDAGGALISVSAGGVVAVMAPPRTGGFHPRGFVITLPAPNAGMCLGKADQKRSEYGINASPFTTP